MKSFLIEHMSAIGNWSSLGLLVALVFVPLFVCAARRRKYLRTWWITWAGMLAWAILTGFVLPLGLFRITGDKSVWNHFPEPAGIVAIAVAGWFTAAILTVVVKSVFEFFFNRRSAAMGAPRTETN